MVLSSQSSVKATRVSSSRIFLSSRRHELRHICVKKVFLDVWLTDADGAGWIHGIVRVATL